MTIATILGRSVLVLVSVAAAFEVTVRVDDWSQFGMPFTSPTRAMGELFVRDADGPHARPGSQFRQFRIDTRGFRGPDVSDDSLSRSSVIVTAGASETFGLYEAAGKEWPRQLSDSLAARCATTPTVVFNSAFVGMTLPTVTADVERRIRRVHPRMLVYYPTPMQYLEGDIPVATPPDSSGGTRRESPWRSRALPRIRDAMKRSTPEVVIDLLRRVSRSTSGVPVRFSTVPVDRLDRFEQDLRQLVGTARAVGATPVLMAHQNRFVTTATASDQRWLRAWEGFYPLATGPVLVAFDSLARERTRVVARDSGALYVDPEGALRQHPPQQTFADFSHFTTLGAAIVAGSVAAQLSPALSCGVSP